LTLCETTQDKIDENTQQEPIQKHDVMTDNHQTYKKTKKRSYRTNKNKFINENITGIIVFAKDISQIALYI
jgi:hypothetical protein